MMKNNKYYLCWLLFIASIFQLSGKVDEFRERIYLQTDKQSYLAGEPVWMKLLTTDSEQIPVMFSKVAYVELLNDSVSHLQIKVELRNGTGEGFMQLPVDLPTGYYRLVAYTQFMRNEGSEIYFEKHIGIINTFQANNILRAETENNFSPNNVSYSETVSLQSDKTVYTTREYGELIINNLPEAVHTLSVSIAGKDFIPVAESNVLSLKKQPTKLPSYSKKFIPEYEGHIVTGKIVDNQTGNYYEPDDARMFPYLTFSGEGIRFFAGQKGKSGEVLFFTSNISGLKEVSTTVVYSEEQYRVDIVSPFIQRHETKQMPTLQIDTAYNKQLLERSVALQVMHYLSEDFQTDQSISDPFFKMKPTWSYILDEYTRFTTMGEVFTEITFGARFRREGGKRQLSILINRGNYYDYVFVPLVLLDGIPITDHEIIYHYDPLSVERINVYSGPYIMGGHIIDGIIELSTYRRNHSDITLDKSTQILTYEGTQLHRTFYTPDYSQEKNRQNRLPDNRHTLLWIPNVQTDGKSSIRLPFDTSDFKGEFQVTVEGLDKDGNAIFAKSFFKVE